MRKLLKRYSVEMAALLTALVIALGTGMFAYAQVPALFITSPTGGEIVDLQGAGAQIESVLLSQLRDSAGYQALAQAATNTLTVPNGVSVIAFHGTTSGTATITLAAVPQDGQLFHLFSVEGLSAVTLTANTGQTVNNAVTSLSANTGVTYLYVAATKNWYRVQ